MRGKMMPNATNAANAVVAWPDGKLAYSGRHENGSETKGPMAGGPTRPIHRLTTVLTNPGKPTPPNKKPTPALTMANTPRDIDTRALRGRALNGKWQC